MITWAALGAAGRALIDNTKLLFVVAIIGAALWLLTEYLEEARASERLRGQNRELAVNAMMTEASLRAELRFQEQQREALAQSEAANDQLRAEMDNLRRQTNAARGTDRDGQLAPVLSDALDGLRFSILAGRGDGVDAP